MEMSEFYSDIQNTIVYYRKLFGLTQEQLAERADLSTDYIGKIEAGINKPGLIGLYKIISALNVPIKDFFANFH